VTDIISSFPESPIGRAIILMIMYIATLKSDVIVFISIKRHYVMSH